MEQCNIGEVARAGVFADINNIHIIDNVFDVVSTHAFTGNSNVFNFSGNVVTKMEDEPFQASALVIQFSNNQLNKVVGSPFKSLSPTPKCVVDKTIDEGVILDLILDNMNFKQTTIV